MHKPLTPRGAALAPVLVPPPKLFVFHLEDDPNDRILLKLAWKQTKCPVKSRFAESASEGLAYFATLVSPGARQHARWPDLAVLDVFMPACSGFELLRYIRATGPLRNLPVVMFTGNSSGQLADEAYARGANSVLVKPVSFDETARTLASLYRRWSVAKLPAR